MLNVLDLLLMPGEFMIVSIVLLWHYEAPNIRLPLPLSRAYDRAGCLKLQVFSVVDRCGSAASSRSCLMPGWDIRGFEHTGCATNVKVYDGLIFMDPCIVDDSVEIPTRCSYVIELSIPKFIVEVPTRCSYVIEFIIPTFIVEIPTRCSYVI